MAAIGPEGLAETFAGLKAHALQRVLKLTELLSNTVLLLLQLLQCLAQLVCGHLVGLLLAGTVVARLRLALFTRHGIAALLTVA